MKVEAGLALAALLLIGAAGDPGKGKALYKANCALCHGDSGKGDGVAGSGSDPKPANFTDPHYMARLDDTFAKAVMKLGKHEATKQGPKFGYTALWMPASPSFKDTEITQLIALIRDIQKTKPAPEKVPEVTARHPEAFALFKANCQRCHGENFDGNGPDTVVKDKDGKKLLVQPLPPDFRDDLFMGRYKDTTLKKVIRSGREEAESKGQVAVMIGLAATWSGAQLADVIAYIRTMVPPSREKK